MQLYKCFNTSPNKLSWDMAMVKQSWSQVMVFSYFSKVLVKVNKNCPWEKNHSLFILMVCHGDDVAGVISMDGCWELKLQIVYINYIML